MKRKRLLSTAVGILILISLLTGSVFSFPNEASATFKVLNPLGNITPVYNQPLAERTLNSFSGMKIALVYYSRMMGPQSMRAIGNLAGAEGATVTEFNIGSEIGAKPQGYYETLAEYDAVVIGVANCTFSAWWGAYHAKMIEALGTPAVLLVHEVYLDTHDTAKLDNGFTAARRAVVPATLYDNMLTVLRNNSVAPLQNAFDTSGGVYAQVKSALTDELTAVERAPAAITPRQLAGWTIGDPTAETLTIPESDEVKAAQTFNSMAMELGFGDGLPVIMPLEELVDEMLAATTRDRFEVIGKIMPRGGIITVEKVAINSVMAGARPEYFPAVLAAMEAYATSWEDGNLLYHTLTSSENYTLMLIFSGPIVDELGISGRWGFLSSGNEANNAIGRAVRLSARNIGVNRTKVTDGTSRQGRQNDHALTVLGEDSNSIPKGWEGHNEMLGFNKDQSTVTLHGYWASNMYSSSGGINAAFIPLDAVNSSLTYAGRNNVGIITMPANVANLLQNGNALPSTANIGGAPANNTPVQSKRELQDRLALTSDNRALIFPVVVGDTESVRGYTGTFAAATKYYGVQAFQSRVITGATLTEAGSEQAPPGAPTNVRARYEDGNVTVYWNAPQGGGDELRYQVSRTGGAAGGVANPGGVLPNTTALTIPAPSAVSGQTALTYPSAAFDNSHANNPSWIDIPQGEMSITFENVNPNDTGNNDFWVRTVNDSVRNAVEVAQTGTTYALDYNASGRGAWAGAVVEIAPTSIRIDGASLATARKNTTKQLTLTVMPEEAVREIVWSSSSTAIASVDENGLVTMNATGTAIITAKTADGKLTSMVTIRVTA